MFLIPRSSLNIMIGMFHIFTVYENSGDIALSTNVDNVYSNAGQKGLKKKEERGYKVYATWKCLVFFSILIVHFDCDFC